MAVSHIDEHWYTFGVNDIIGKINEVSDSFALGWRNVLGFIMPLIKHIC